MKQALLVLLISGIYSARSQQPTFSESEFIAVIKKFHPVVKVAANDIRIAQWEITASRAAFDPQWQTQNARKDFDGTTYYNQLLHELKIPTWYGIDLYARQETITGSRINPEETKGSVSYVGFSVPLIQNMVMDKRRAFLLLAKNQFELSAVERQIAVNDLLREALETYWNWWEQYRVYDLMQATLANAERRFELTKSAYRLGDRPAIDTLEALTQVQSFQLRVAEALAEYTKARLALSAYLWREDNTPVSLAPAVIPQAVDMSRPLALDELLIAVGNHPELRKVTFKLNGLAIERKLKFQLLLPEVRFKYNHLDRDLFKTVDRGLFASNYNYALSFVMPLRLSEGRAAYAQAKLKIENTRIEQSNKQLQLQVKVKQYYTDWQLTVNQLATQGSLARNISGLQRAEEIRFANGESSLFLVNTREQKTIEVAQKLIELEAKNRKAVVKLLWAAGLIEPGY